jgi:hypothetical protein
MTAVRLTLEDGLSAVPGEGGQNTVLDPTVNVFRFGERVIRRGGCKPIDCVPFDTMQDVASAVIAVQWGESDDWPLAGYASTGSAIQSSANDTLYMAVGQGCAGILFYVLQAALATTVLPQRPTLYVYDPVAAEWVEAGYEVIGLPTLRSDGTTAIYPGVAHRGSTGVPASLIATAYYIAIDPSSGWSESYTTHGSETGCWVKLVWPSTAVCASAEFDIDNMKHIPIGGQPILHINTWEDEFGTPHRFFVHLNGDVPAYVLDGASLTEGTDLSPESVTGVVAFDEHTNVWSAYHPATQRLIGYVQGRGWFYLVPGNGEIYDFVAGDPTGTVFESLPAGCRSAIPDGDVFALHDGRIFVGSGQNLTWSAEGAFADIWPNDNEIFLADDAGPITGIASAAGQLLVFKRDATWVLTATGEDGGYAAERIAGGLGCIAPKSCAVAGGYVYRLTESGPAVYDGNQDHYVDGRIQRLFAKKFSANPREAVGLFFGGYNQYRLLYSTDGMELNEALYGVIDEPLDVRWWKQGRRTAGSYGLRANCAMLDKTAESNVMLTGDRSGVVWQQDTGDYDLGAEIECVVTTNELANKTTQVRRGRRITPSLASDNFLAETTLTFIPDGSRRSTQSLTLTDQHPSWKLPEGDAQWGWFGQLDTFTGLDSFAESAPREQAREFHIGARCRKFQVEVTRESHHPLELLCIELELNDAGNRNE